MNYTTYRRIMRAGDSRGLLYVADVGGTPWIGNSYFAYTMSTCPHAAKLVDSREPSMFTLGKDLVADDREVPNVARIVEDARDRSTEKLTRATWQGLRIVLDQEPAEIPFLIADDDSRAVRLNAEFYNLLADELLLDDFEPRILGSDPCRVIVVEGQRGQGIIMPIRAR